MLVPFFPTSTRKICGVSCILMENTFIRTYVDGVERHNQVCSWVAGVERRRLSGCVACSICISMSMIHANGGLKGTPKNALETNECRRTDQELVDGRAQLPGYLCGGARPQVHQPAEEDGRRWGGGLCGVCLGGCGCFPWCHLFLSSVINVRTCTATGWRSVAMQGSKQTWNHPFRSTKSRWP